ncbi:hypothetical protein I7I50_11392 [Histoplasma capsulatum G186AR]|uniref:Uncharacterized protein n=1 Tax=Ajellomyces capsulatus TaxID=5037 RepID=A0A8H8D7Y1_AJECA|nr:hypothetical protein I7I52_02630 [Histoplasma capsulatum]QSS69937.1 hypothetical protein I7I50_11392 [Histoplasma capsulatum G186AR]
MPEENTQSSSKTSQNSGQRESETKEATGTLVADLQTLKQLTSSSAAAKEKRARNVLDRVLQNTFLDMEAEQGTTANNNDKSRENS